MSVQCYQRRKKKTMAKLGEGDSRWIVADREDGKNPNAWHWDQKDKTKVCEARLKELFSNRTLYEQPEFRIVAKELNGFEGDVTIANRKGKLRCFFEIKFTIKWQAIQGEKDELYDGKLIVNDCDTQNYVEAYDVSVTSDGTPSGLKERALQTVQTQGRTAVRAIVKDFIDNEMMKANGVEACPMISKSTTGITGSPAPETDSATAQKTSSSKPTTTDGITFKITWTASLQDIFECFVKEAKIAAFTRAPCSMKSRVCGDFSMLGGAITGTFVELVEGKRIVMKWRLSSWKKDEGTNSVVTIDFSGVDGACVTEFMHTGVPPAEVDRVKQGWEVNFWGGMKQILGYNHDLQLS